MRRTVLALFMALSCMSATAGEAEVKAAQQSIDAQLQALLRDDPATAYSYAAPNVKRIFPTVDTFMNMVTNGYPPVRRPKTYAFGKSQEVAAGQIAQQVLLVGPDGKDYEALYTLELQPDGTFRITGVSLRASNALST